jgi:predicted RNA binding protein YcfA (HicA-like mRNA interferase family)
LRIEAKTVIAKLKAAGWTLDRISGSHHIMMKEGKAVSAPTHARRDIGAGLLSAIVRESGLKLK